MRKLKLNINDKEYVLELNRNAIKWLEDKGYEPIKFESKPLTYFEMLWESLFIANYQNTVSHNLAMKLMETYEEKHNVTSVIKFAIEEYATFMNALADTNSMENEKLEIIEA